MILGMFGKAFHVTKESKIRTWIFRGISWMISAYGVYALFKRNFISYITLQIHFVLFDYEESIIYYELDLIAIVIFMIFLGFNLQKLIINMNKRRN